MKKIVVLTLIAGLFTGMSASSQQDKSKRPSPPAKVSETIASGATITINYSQPSLKGRKIGTDIAPYGVVWRTGANEATVFETSKDLKIEGKTLPAGKYSLYSIPGTDKWTFIFNKIWDQWGTLYEENQDALRVDVKPLKSAANMEKMTFKIAKEGKISLMWADVQADLNVK
ncbi:DUF2911 domain-containing protein [Daejeonella oryzae]|uniref:DUF2911 domain-containing protein n=1 Tax=Daejeonella oryzae TaxID=1122943 RepID=UPI0003FFD518|nr:DUF2911 domain-containing protein [Daejeonella oryzae]